MSMTLSGSGTITGLVAGGLPDATVIQSDLAANVASNGPAFRYYAASSTVVLTANTDVKLVFDTATFDTTGGMFSSSRFTPTIAGYYQVNAAMGVPYWNGVIMTCEIFKNGTSYSYGGSPFPQTTGNVHANVSDIVYCNGSTDYIEIYGYQYNAVTNITTSTGTATTYFSASLIRAA